MQLLTIFLTLFSLSKCHIPFYNMMGATNMLTNNPASRQLMSGRFVMRLMPGDSMYMGRYLDLWGLSDEMKEQMTTNPPPIEISVSEDGTTLTMDYKMPDGSFVTTLKFGETGTMTGMTGKEQTCTAYMLSPNSFAIQTMIKEDNLHDLKTFTFNPMGVQVKTDRSFSERLVLVLVVLVLIFLYFLNIAYRKLAS